MTTALPKRHTIDPALTWDTSLLFDSFELFKKALNDYETDALTFIQLYEGRLTTSDTIASALKQYEQLLSQNDRLEHYVVLNFEVDRKNETVAQQYNVYEVVFNRIQPKLSFVTRELQQLDRQTLETFNREYPQYTGFITELINQKQYALSPENEALLSQLTPSFSHPYTQYNTTKFEDMTFESFKANGQTYANSYVLFENDYEISQDKTLRHNASTSFYSTLNAYKNTTASIYLAHVKNEQLLARLRGFNSTIDYLLHQQNVSRDLFDRQIDVIMNELAPHMRRYVKLVAKQHGLEKITHADLKLSMPSTYNQRITPEESRQLLKETLHVFGEDYAKMIDRSFDERWIDFAQNDGKSTGGFCATVYNGPSYILLSWTGLMNEVLVLAHELGHAGHFQWANKQSILNTRPSLYFIEAPSTANEVLACNALLKQNDDPNFHIYLISEFISRTYYHNMVTHLLEAAFQREVYTRLDNNEYLNGSILCQIKQSIMQQFWGDEFEIGEDAGLIWMRQPHYYLGLYPYTYSAGLTIGTAMAKLLEENGKEVSQKWLDTMALGASLPPLELAKFAGVDVSTDQPLKETIAYVGSLVDRLEKLV